MRASACGMACRTDRKGKLSGFYFICIYRTNWLRGKYTILPERKIFSWRDVENMVTDEWKNIVQFKYVFRPFYIILLRWIHHWHVVLYTLFHLNFKLMWLTFFFCSLSYLISSLFFFLFCIKCIFFRTFCWNHRTNMRYNGCFLTTTPQSLHRKSFCNVKYR